MTALSVMICLSSRPEVAPIARRTASSCSRRLTNPSVRLATFVTAMSRSRQTAPSSTRSGSRASPVICADKPTRFADHPSFPLSSIARCAAIPCTSRSAAFTGTPGFTRPTTSRNRPHPRLLSVGPNGRQNAWSFSHENRGGSKLGGMTPTIVCGRPSSDSVRPIDVVDRHRSGCARSHR